MPLSPGPVAGKDMDHRQWSRWCREQQIHSDDNSVGTNALQDSAVTFPKVQQIAADRVLGRLSSAGVLQELTPAQLFALLDALDWAFIGDVGFFGTAPVGQQATYAGLALTPVGGTGDDATINASFSTVQNALNAIKAALDGLGLTG